jgi:hypothetical protein
LEALKVIAAFGTGIAHRSAMKRTANTKETQTMTTITRTSIIALIFSTLSFAGIYPPQEGDLTAEIPFQFVLQGKTLPAGNYIMRADEGQVEICEDGVYCETVKTYSRAGEKAAGRIEFRHDGTAYHLTVLQVVAGMRHQMPAEPEPMIMPSGDGDESITSIEARPLCIHNHAGTALTPAWH